ncbi:hypothetical protein E3J61_00600 [Candidatus Dependentiae bacterium]|nr:MAG: hypothetical protein E3J61_00600 [Candidatus Dependentiae bacterium]
MKLIISTPSSYRELSVAWLEFNAPTGNYVIQQGHAPMIMTLVPNQKLIFRLKSGKEESILIRQGMVTIGREETTAIITEQEA